MEYLRKLVSTFHKDYPNKLIAIFPSIGLAPPIAKRNALPNINCKRKCGQPVGNVQNKAKH